MQIDKNRISQTHSTAANLRTTFLSNQITLLTAKIVIRQQNIKQQLTFGVDATIYVIQTITVKVGISAAISCVETEAD